MKAQENQLLPLLNGKKQFIIPIYQRTYNWTQEQCEQLWHDIVRAATDPHISAHFLGSVVYIQYDPIMIAMPQFLLIDGQQRLTTLTLLLIALAQVAQATPSAQISKEDIYVSYIINEFGKDEKRYKLLLTQSDKETLIELIDHPQKAQALDGGGHLLENYLYFQQQLQHTDIGIDTIFEGINKLVIVEISLLKNVDNPQFIFESLNSTGMDLSQADLIRNYVLMGLDTEEQRQLYKDYWYPMEQRFRQDDNINQFDRFMRDYLTLKQGEIPNIDRVYSTFKTYHRSQAATPMKDLVEDIARYANYFANMAFLHEKDTDLKQALQEINRLKVDVAYPFFLELYDDYANQHLSKQDFIALIELVESYVFRRAICGIPTNALNKVFSTLSKEIDKEQYLESVQRALLTKGGNTRFPGDDEFRNAFVVKDVYNYPRRNYLLRKLENHGQKEIVNIESCTIEHILPQKKELSVAWQKELGPDWKEVQTRYLHTIGNLTLTEYNSELSDRPFQEKRDMENGLGRSLIRLNKGLAQVEQWNKEAIEKRAEQLAQRAIRIWSLPTLSADQIHPAGKRGKKVSLVEVIGPAEHPLAGTVPEGFKLIQSSEKRFYLFRHLDGEWVQYGNGKNPWFTISWDYAQKWVQEKYRKNELPLGVGGDKVMQVNAAANNTSILTDYKSNDPVNGSTHYAICDHPFLQGNVLALFKQLQKRILNLDVSVREEVKKQYIAYKTTSNFADVEPQKKRLRITLNLPFNEIDDPKGLCKNLTGIGHYGNGDVEISLTSSDQLDDAMDLIRQSFERHSDEYVLS